MKLSNMFLFLIYLVLASLLFYKFILGGTYFEDRIYYNYIDEIDSHDKDIRKLVFSIVEECDGEKSCQIINIYDFVINEINYNSDPRDDELIQSPRRTLFLKGGDCEDLTILLNSLYESIGISTKMAFTDTHAFSLVCISDLKNYKYELFKRGFSNSVISFNLNGNSCLVVDATLDKNSYPGMNLEINQSFVAIDSVTKNKILIDPLTVIN